MTADRNADGGTGRPEGNDLPPARRRAQNANQRPIVDLTDPAVRRRELIRAVALLTPPSRAELDRLQSRDAHPQPGRAAIRAETVGRWLWARRTRRGART